MDLESRKERKNKGLRGIANSTKYSIEGLKYAFKNEQSIKLIIFATLSGLILGVTLQINTIEWIFVAIALGIILATELINTAIEATIDLVSPDFHPLAKIAKDTASAAVFVYTLLGFILAIAIFIPKIIERLGS